MTEVTSDVSKRKKDLLRTIGLRALIGSVLFGGFCVFIAPSTTTPLTVPDVVKIVLAGITYALSYNIVISFARVISVVLVALAVHDLLPVPAALLVLVPMIIAGLSSEYLAPYPKPDRSGDKK